MWLSTGAQLYRAPNLSTHPIEGWSPHVRNNRRPRCFEPDEPPAPVRHLRGNLGVASIVFMVVAAAAPLGVIGGVVPLGIASGNGAGFPATFIISTVILLFFAVGFTAMTPYVEEAGAFFSYVRKSLGFPTGIGIAFVAIVSYLAIEAGVYGLLGPAGASRRRTVRRPSAALVAVRGGGIRGHDLPRLPQHRAVQPGAGGAADRRDRDRGGARSGHRRPRRRPRIVERHRQPATRSSPDHWASGCFSHDQLRRLRGDRDLPRRGPHARTHHSARDLHRAHPDRRVLRGDQLGADLGVGRRRGGKQGNRFRRHLPRRHRAALHRRRGRRHHHGAVLHQPVRLHPVIPQRGVALCVRAVSARRPARSR